MKKILNIITLLSIVIFVLAWLKFLPAPIRHYALMFSPVVVVVGLLLTAGGLEAKAKRIMQVSSLVIFIVSTALSIRYLFYGGEQGGIGVLFVWFIAGVVIVAIYLLLVLTTVLWKKILRR